MTRVSSPALPGSAALFALGWGSNQFAPLVVAYQVAAGASAAATETMFVLYAVGLVPGLFVGGHLSDRFGRRAVIMSALSLAAISSVLLMVGGLTLGLLYVGRLVAGIASGIGFSAGTAWVKEQSHKDHGARHAVIAMTTGFALGPLVAGVLAAVDPRQLWLPYLPHVIVTLVALILVARARTGRGSHPSVTQTPLCGPALIRMPTFWKVIMPLAPWVFLTAAVALATLPAAVPGHSVGGPLWSAALVTPLPAVAGVTVQSLVRHMHHLRDQVVLGLTAAATGLALGAGAVAVQSFVLMLISCIVLGVAYGICQTAGLHAVTTLSAPHRLGQSIASYQAVTYLGYLAPLPIVALGRVVDLALILAVLAGLAVLTIAIILPSTTRGTDDESTADERTPRPAADERSEGR